MRYTLLGKTGMEVSKVGFGGIPIQRLNQDKVDEIIDKAIEMGINFYDTARGYTVSEKLMGNALEGRRSRVFIATKSMVRDKDGMLSEVDTSLKNLKTDYIDLYQLHNVGSEEELNKTLDKGGAYEALQKLKDEGVVKHIGITSHKESVIERALETDLFETVQFPYNAVESHGEEVFKLALEKGVGTIAMKPMAGGALRHGQNALKFILESPYLNVAIPGIDSVDQVVENAEATDDMRLTFEERDELLKEVKELGQAFCRRCGYCLPCPQGIDIPQMFLMEGYYTRYNLKDWAVSRYTAFSKKAEDCIKCGTCETRCPYELPIREMLDKVNSIFTQK